MDAGELPGPDDPSGSNNYKDHVLKYLSREYIPKTTKFSKCPAFYKFYCKFKIPPLEIITRLCEDFYSKTSNFFQPKTNFFLFLLITNPVFKIISFLIPKHNTNCFFNIILRFVQIYFYELPVISLKHNKELTPM